MSITENFARVTSEIDDDIIIVAVSKTKPIEVIQEAYNLGQRIFGENRVQELAQKNETLPKDIQWHAIGHLQRNKIKYIASFISLIHSVDTFKLLLAINKEAMKQNRTIDVLLQVYIANEDTKHGFLPSDIEMLMKSKDLNDLKNICIRGLMGMATNTKDEEVIRGEFKGLKKLYNGIKDTNLPNVDMKFLSMGMSNDFRIAIEEGSNMIRIGSLIFGKRD
ncbi:MAG TPA: YggS family pyridoxal phosphate-dependent enzyme [Flavobacteriales bacterium]|nr:YggS family pyridoxal phosphate-dependent enzyme [Flavobacteriales bacterium]HIN39511.1 YggS family pyridoxal phosphate-dependent enzyme [Flavobacteriales bacterium]